jgi:hypothetical protein
VTIHARQQQAVVTDVNLTSPLKVGNVIVLLNGIALPNVSGGMGAWVKIFGLFTDRTVVVQ